MPDVTPEPIMRIAMGFMAAKHLFVAAAIGLFEHLASGPAPLMSGEFLVHSGEGQAYGEDDADRWLAQTGWRKLEHRPLAGPASVIIAEAV